MKRFLKVCAFYTEGTTYEDEAALLAKSLDAVGMKYEIKGVRDRGDWDANTMLKAEFIEDQRRKHYGGLLYVDVDAFVHENCEEFFRQLELEDMDFAVHWFCGPNGGYDESLVRDGGWWMLSGTMWFGDTHGARRLIRRWRELNRFMVQNGMMQGGGQANLWYTVKRSDGLRMVDLPGEYCYVFDKPWAYDDDIVPIIEHTIASREHRGKSDGLTHAGRQRRIAELALAV